MRLQLQCNNLNFSYGDEQVLHHVDLAVSAPESVALVGPSGSGKSTLLMCLSGVIPAPAGTVIFDGVDLGAASDEERTRIRARSFGFVMQFGGLVPELTLHENVRLAQSLKRTSADDDEIRDLFVRLGIDEVRDSFPARVSGGQRQRAAVARALVGQPAFVFADEPTGALDTRNTEVVFDLLLELARERESGCVVVTHDNRHLARFDRTVHLVDGQTRAA